MINVRVNNFFLPRCSVKLPILWKSSKTLDFFYEWITNVVFDFSIVGGCVCAHSNRPIGSLIAPNGFEKWKIKISKRAQEQTLRCQSSNCASEINSPNSNLEHFIVQWIEINYLVSLKIILSRLGWVREKMDLIWRYLLWHLVVFFLLLFVWVISACEQVGTKSHIVRDGSVVEECVYGDDYIGVRISLLRER